MSPLELAERLVMLVIELVGLEAAKKLLVSKEAVVLANDTADAIEKERFGQ